MNSVKDLPSCNLKRSRGNPNWGVALPYDVVKDIIKPHNFTTLYEYTKWVRDMRMQGGGHGLPIHPQPVFTRKGEWVSKEDFLGLSPKSRGYNKKSQSALKQPDYERSFIRMSKIKTLSTIIRQVLGFSK